MRGTDLAGLDGPAGAVYQLRQLLQMTTLNANEAGLRALIHRHLRKPSKTNMDRDKIDFLLVQYFALCAPAKVYHKQIELEDVAQVMKPIIGDVSDFTDVVVRASREDDRVAARLSAAFATCSRQISWSRAAK